jgi:hypothetical protein
MAGDRSSMSLEILDIGVCHLLLSAFVNLL